MPKFINYISHDEILGAFYRAIGWKDHFKGALPASTLYFEFFTRQTKKLEEQRFLNDELSLQQTTSQHMVRIFFNDTAGRDGVYVNLNNTKNTGKFEMTLDEFTSRVSATLEAYPFNNVRETCSNNKFNFNQTYLDPKKWREEMTVLYPRIKDAGVTRFLMSLSVLASAVVAALVF